MGGMLGVSVGFPVGRSVGLLEGNTVGVLVLGGHFGGLVDGTIVGVIVGDTDGSHVGWTPFWQSGSLKSSVKCRFPAASIFFHWHVVL